MQRLDVLEALKAEISEEDRLATLTTMIESQIRALERMLENNAGFAKDPGAWNTVAGLIDQLRFYAPRAFYSSEINLDWLKDYEGGPPVHPLANKE